MQLETPARGSHNVLGLLDYDASERHQGECGNCWAWASTGVVEVDLKVNKGVSDRLSIQYLNSCLDDDFACCGGTVEMFVDFYEENPNFIPQTNNNAGYADASSLCRDGSSDLLCQSIETEPGYPIDSINYIVIDTTNTGKNQAIDNIKSVLDQDRAVVFSFFLPDGDSWGEFFDFWENKGPAELWDHDGYCGMMYSDDPQDGGGGHGVVAVGYNDEDPDPDNHYWVMLNSWGTANGNRPDGTFRMKMNADYDCSFINFEWPALEWETINVQWGEFNDVDKTVGEVVAGGMDFLFNNFHDNGDGTGYYWDSFRGSNDRNRLAATSAAVVGLIEAGKYSDADYREQIDKAVAYIKDYKKADGGIYVSNATYETGLALMALAIYHDVNPQDEDYLSLYIQETVDYFLDGQFDDGSWSYGPCQTRAGGCEGGTGDLSNTQFPIMGMYYAYVYTDALPNIPTSQEGSWANRLKSYVKSTQAESGSFSYYDIDKRGTSYAQAPMNGAGLWILQMLGLDTADEAIQNSLAYFNDNYGWSKEDLVPNRAYFYAAYAMAKGLYGFPGYDDYVFEAADNPWVKDFEQAMVEEAIHLDDGTYYWFSNTSLDPGSIISTSWIIGALAWVDPEVESTRAIISDTEDADFPIKGEGTVALTSTGDATITNASRLNIGIAQLGHDSELPIGGFEFTLNNVNPEENIVFRLTPPGAAFDPENPASFVKPDGSPKDNLAWFTIDNNGVWAPEPDARVKLLPEGGPYNRIEVTFIIAPQSRSTGLNFLNQRNVGDGTMFVRGAPGIARGADEPQWEDRLWVTAFYVAYWERSPDPEGYDFWMSEYNAGKFVHIGFAGIAENFAPLPEGLGAYEYFQAAFDPFREISVQMRQDFIKQVYLNLFNRLPGEANDPDALDGWVKVLESGEYSPGRFIADIIYSAQMGQGNDWAVLWNKIQVADYFRERMLAEKGYNWDAVADRASAIWVLEGIGADSASVQAGKDRVDGLF